VAGGSGKGDTDLPSVAIAAAARPRPALPATTAITSAGPCRRAGHRALPGPARTTPAKRAGWMSTQPWPRGASAGMGVVRPLRCPCSSPAIGSGRHRTSRGVEGRLGSRSAACHLGRRPGPGTGVGSAPAPVGSPRATPANAPAARSAAAAATTTMTVKADWNPSRAAASGAAGPASWIASLARAAADEKGKELRAPCHFQFIAHWGACGKTPVVLHNLRPKPEPAEIRDSRRRRRGCARRRTARSSWSEFHLVEWGSSCLT
jgi:hypothetical protein